MMAMEIAIERQLQRLRSEWRRALDCELLVPEASHPASPIWGLVLAGGDGTRLAGFTTWLTGEAVPKQYCRFVAGRSLLELTLDRLTPHIPPARTAVIVNRDHARWAAPQLDPRRIGEVIVQPRNRDTGPGMMLSLLRIALRDPRAIVVVAPSDHWVSDDAAFMMHVMDAVGAVEQHPDRLVCLGVVPDHPDTGLGYLVPGSTRLAGTRAADVTGFCEKPDPLQAGRLIAAGAVWNAFVMAFRADTVLDLLEQSRADDLSRLAAALGDYGSVAAVYESLPSWNFSREVLTRAPERLAVVPLWGVGWSDWGTPEAIGRTLGSDQSLWTGSRTAS
jgi:mannose-1-phosphate guanylyltransferase